MLPLSKTYRPVEIEAQATKVPANWLLNFFQKCLSRITPTERAQGASNHHVYSGVILNKISFHYTGMMYSANSAGDGSCIFSNEWQLKLLTRCLSVSTATENVESDTIANLE